MAFPKSLDRTAASVGKLFTQNVIDVIRKMSVEDLLKIHSRKRTASGAPAEKVVEKAAAKAGKAKPTKGKAVKAAKPAKAIKPEGRRLRRTTEDVAELANKAVAYIEKKPGSAVSDIAAALGVEVEEVVRPLTIAKGEGRIHTTGTKRMTRYFPGAEPDPKASTPEEAAPPSGEAPSPDAESPAPAASAPAA